MTDPDSIHGLAALWRRQEAIAAGTGNDATGDAETDRTLDRAQATLARLALMPATNAAELATKLLVLFQDRDDWLPSGGLAASIIADCERLAGG
jgi:hypothetical protein